MLAEVLTCGYSYHAQPFFIDQRDGLVNYLFRLQTEGSCQAYVDGKMTTLKPGDLLLYKPGDAYALSIKEHVNELGQNVIASADYYVVAAGLWLDEWWGRNRKQQCVRINPDEKLISLWRHIILEKRRFKEDNRELLQLLFQALCLSIDQAIKDTALPQGRSFTALRMKAFIEENAVSPFKVQDVARHAGLSVSRAVHLFKECYGKTMIEYTMELRLLTAIERMKYSFMTLEQIAETSGFGSYTYFHRVFRERYGMSPSDYRRQAAMSGSGLMPGTPSP
ncbi:AraC family transcriptional regulator [Paenibacillus silviterrae]|uniref:AraC family transcriptional regulator n=1 Tax=Paenibacillus silviterrae TaxID=3242194 RepID=UPI0025429C28|nr:AraC family transcriptional regulator [Paenibacillus chinjuensis]